ncbi:MAG: NDP-sugar synthase [Gemmatimonadetes bacterium]|nr:NDP-sugar synthase [Gemmatimonadota bacterium]MYB60735.1 NDP-sugar synthase [Gemmatimonadota bacterium]
MGFDRSRPAAGSRRSMDDNGLVRGVILTEDRDAAGPAEWDSCPDLLLPLANKPLVEWMLAEYARAGVRESLIAAGRDTGEIAEFCGDGARWGMSLAYWEERDSRDAWEARDARTARDAPAGQRLCRFVREVTAFTKDAPFLVSTGPQLLESEVYAQLVQSYREHRPCGIRAGRITGHTSGTSRYIAEHTRIYLMTARTCEVLVNKSTHDHTLNGLFGAALVDLAGRGETVLNLDLEHPPFDVRSPEAYLASNERMLASGPESTRSALPEIMDDNFSSPNLVMRPPVIVDDTAELERCRIGPGVSIGPGVRIGHGAAIEHSVIMTGADVGDGASISYAVIGKYAGIENRAILHGSADRVIVVRSRHASSVGT